jgi:hypothetical protein
MHWIYLLDVGVQRSSIDKSSLITFTAEIQAVDVEEAPGTSYCTKIRCKSLKTCKF